MFEEILSHIKAADIITIHGHRNPDGDCFGSQMAVKLAINASYPKKKVFVVGSGLNGYENIIGNTDVVSDDIIKESLAIIVDANDFSRCEDQRVSTAHDFVKIDHHVDTGSFLGPQVVDERSDSTCSLVLEMLKEGCLIIDEKCANALYLGILTDTGRFQFSFDYKKTFENVGYILRKGANPREIVNILNTRTPNVVSFKGHYFSKARYNEHGVLWVALSQKDFKKFNVDESLASEYVNLLSNVKGIKLWVSFTERKDGTLHCEFRSDYLNVQKVASVLGGGGHKHASGTTLPKYNAKNIKYILTLLNEVADQEVK